MKRLLMSVAVAMLTIAAWAELVPPGTEEQIRERLTPVGEVCRAGDECAGGGAVAASGGGTGLSGEAIYGQFCFACHDNGVADAPKFGDPAAWADRAAKGIDALVETSLSGINMMPPMGTCMNCTPEEMQSAIEFILDKSS